MPFILQTNRLSKKIGSKMLVTETFGNLPAVRLSCSGKG